MIEEKKEEDKIIRDGKTKKPNLVKWLFIIFVILVFVILIVIKWQKPNFPFKWVFFIEGFIISLGGVIFFGFNAYRKYQQLKEKKEEDKIPPPAAPEIIFKKMHECITNKNLRNHVKRYIHKEYNINKNKIYVFSVELLYLDKYLGKTAYIIINANFPNSLPTIEKGNIKGSILKNLINMKSINPKEEPETEKTESFSPLTQTYLKTEKKIPRKKYKKLPQKHEEELA